MYSERQRNVNNHSTDSCRGSVTRKGIYDVFALHAEPPCSRGPCAKKSKPALQVGLGLNDAQREKKEKRTRPWISLYRRTEMIRESTRYVRWLTCK